MTIVEVTHIERSEPFNVITEYSDTVPPGIFPAVQLDDNSYVGAFVASAAWPDATNYVQYSDGRREEVQS